MIAQIATCLILLSWPHNGIARQAGASSLRRGTSTNKSDKYQRVLAPSSWNQLGQTIVGEAKDDFAGNAVAMNAEGTIIAIAARTADSPEQGINAGHVRIFEWDSNTAQWSQKGSNIDGEDEADRSGHQVSLNAAGDIVGISAQFNNNAGGPDSGHVRVYRFDDTRGEWVKLGRDLDGLSTSEWLESVSLSSTGLRVAIGASRHRVGSFYGQVRVYDYDSDAKSWVQVGSDVMGASVGDRLGSSVDLSDDGTIMVRAGVSLEGSFAPQFLMSLLVLSRVDVVLSRVDDRLLEVMAWIVMPPMLITIVEVSKFISLTSPQVIGYRWVRAFSEQARGITLVQRFLFLGMERFWPQVPFSMKPSLVMLASIAMTLTPASGYKAEEML